MHPGDGRVISNFITQALLGRPLTVYGNGEQTRSFCYIDDFLDLLALFMRTPDDVTGPMNMGNPHECTMRELAEWVIELTGSSSVIEYRPLPVDDPCRRCPDISLARSLGWEPGIDLREGLARTIASFDRLLASGEGLATREGGVYSL